MDSDPEHGGDTVFHKDSDKAVPESKSVPMKEAVPNGITGPMMSVFAPASHRMDDQCES